MKRLPPLPSRSELGLFALVALACAGLAAIFRAHDLAMAALALPIFVAAGWMGMRRSGQWAAMNCSSDIPAVEVDSEDELANESIM